MALTTRLALVGLLLASFAGSAAAENAVVNGGFQTSLSSWTSTQVSAVWQSNDASDSAASGSAALTNTLGVPGSQGGGAIFQCVPATGGVKYDFGANIEIPIQGSAGSAQIQVVWYSSPTCTGVIHLIGTGSLTVTGAWFPVGSLAMEAPAGTMSATFSLVNFKTNAGGSFVSYYDDAFLRPSVAQNGLLTLPSITSIHGANQTFFHSDVWILNRSFTSSQSLSFHYLCIGGPTCSTTRSGIPLGPRESRLFPDLVANEFHAPETAGALEIGYDASLGELAASSRLYTPSLPSPTLGFSLPGLHAGDARARAVFVGLGGSGGDLSQGFRTNVGAYNPNSSSVTVTFTLYAASGAVLGSPHVRTYAAVEPFQLNDIFTVVGAHSTVATDAYLVVSTDGLPVFPYVAVIDNQSGDSAWVIPSDDEGP